MPDLPDFLDSLPSSLRWPALVLSAALLTGCQTAPPVPSPPVPVQVCPAPMVRTVPVPVVSPATPCPASLAGLALAHADRLRAMSVPELAQEISRLSEPSDSPLRDVQLAMALTLTKVPTDAQRAQGLLQRVLQQNNPESESLRPLVRLLIAQFAEQRRIEEQGERQAQQLRDAQRRIDQLNERLEAVRAIERSLPVQPAASGAQGNGQRATPP
jgi:hypothetical protein